MFHNRNIIILLDRVSPVPFSFILALHSLFCLLSKTVPICSSWSLWMVVVSFCFSSYFIWFYFYHLFSRCKHTTWETTIAKLNIKKSEDLKEKAFCIPENFLKDAWQPLVVDALLPLQGQAKREYGGSPPYNSYIQYFTVA